MAKCCGDKDDADRPAADRASVSSPCCSASSADKGQAADPLRALAKKYFHLPCSVMTPNDRRLDLLRRLAADYLPECIIERTWQTCLTYDVESHRVKRFVDRELALPYLHIETDYSPLDSARTTMRVEALLETVRARQRTTVCGCP